jgi:hypothetical protein
LLGKVDDVTREAINFDDVCGGVLAREVGGGFVVVLTLTGDRFVGFGLLAHGLFLVSARVARGGGFRVSGRLVVRASLSARVALVCTVARLVVGVCCVAYVESVAVSVALVCTVARLVVGVCCVAYVESVAVSVALVCTVARLVVGVCCVAYVAAFVVLVVALFVL